MPTRLTPGALQELEDLMWNSRRQVSSIYRYWKQGTSPEEIALERGEEDQKKVKDLFDALRILFGHIELPQKGQGRQTAIYEVDFWLNSDIPLSDELIEHFREILRRAERTNLRQSEGYRVPKAPERTAIRKVSGRAPGVYVITRESFKRISEMTGDPLVVKLGWSTNVWDRLATAQTWDPDPLSILRIYPCSDPNIIEAKFHICLDTLKLRYGTGGGSEWFQVEMELIDSIAKSLSLVDKKDDDDIFR